MKKLIGIVVGCVWAAWVVPSAWDLLFPESEGFSFMRLIVAIGGGCVLFGLVQKTLESIGSSHGQESESSRTNDPDE